MILKMRDFFHLVGFAALATSLWMMIGCAGSNDNRTERQIQNSDNQEPVAESKEERKNILFFGNSLTAGLGLADEDQAFPELIQRKIDSLDLPYHCINAGLSGETSAGGRERIDWLMQQPLSVFVLELGANDGLRGIPPSATYENLEAIILKVQAANPECKIILAGMKVPPSMGQAYFNEFESIFTRLATRHDLALIPFLLEDIAGIEELNQSDGIHPTAEGQKIMANHVWSALEPLLD